MKQKFVTFLDYHGEQIIVFPDHIQHAQFAKAVSSAAFSDMEPIAGGFVAEGKCYGESISLRLGSRPRDTELLNQLITGPMPVKVSVSDEIIERNRVDLFPGKTVGLSALTRNQKKRLNKKRRA